MTKSEFSKTVIIYRSHKLQNGLISVDYAPCLNENTVGISRRVVIEDKGGALTSLHFDKCLKDL